MASPSGEDRAGKGCFDSPNPDLRKHLDAETRLSMERTGLAHERTLMGWVRTCFSMIGFGFTIFTFSLSLPSQGHGEQLPSQARTMCLALTAGGTLFMVLAVAQHFKALRRLFNSGLERSFSLAMFAAILVIGAGVLGFLAILNES